jgi:hypothetical protein
MNAAPKNGSRFFSNYTVKKLSKNRKPSADVLAIVTYKFFLQNINL